MAEQDWMSLGPVERLKAPPLREIKVGTRKIALTYVNGEFTAVSGACNHAGGPLGQGRLEGDYIVCPWHGWKYHCVTGQGEPGFEGDCLPRHDLRVENGELWIRLQPATARQRLPHPLHPLAGPLNEHRERSASRVFRRQSWIARIRAIRHRKNSSKSLLSMPAPRSARKAASFA